MGIHNKSSKIQMLEYIRFIAITEVFLIHYINDYIHSDYGWSLLMVSGKLGFAFFFMITAYLLVYTTKPLQKGFLIKKATQLLPKYELILLFVFVASKIVPSLFRTFDISYINFLKSMFLIPYRTPGVQFACPLLPVAWTLEIQIFVFIVFYLFLRITKDTDKTAVISSILFLGLCIFGCITGIDNLLAFAYCRFYMLYFVAGFMIAVIEKKCQNIEVINEFMAKISMGRRTISHFSVIIGLLVFLFGSCFYNENLLAYALVCLCFAYLVLAGNKLVFPCYVVFMGKISYSFFYYITWYVKCLRKCLI